MPSRLNRLLWRLRPGRFVPTACGTVPLEELARPVESLAKLATTKAEVAFAELMPARSVRLERAFVVGQPAVDHFPREPSPVPSVRLYRFQGETRIFGKGLFLRADNRVVLLPRFEFNELGRLDYPANAFSLERQEGEAWIARPPERLHRVEEPCLYVAQGGEGIWGHWLVDIFPRLVMGLGIPAPFKVVIDADTPAWCLHFLAMAGIDRSRVIRHDKFRTTLVVRDLYVPSFLRYGNAFSPLANLAWGLAPVSPAPPSLRLYLSRSRAGRDASLLTAPEIEAVARRRGYRIVHP
ncbi:MAG: glycosyltransferase family 61 protein, partial [Methylobacteriaceae bacterium]|nr:glycosyltransferase family 61 protein [Methylobacteriaceae bacterium]